MCNACNALYDSPALTADLRTATAASLGIRPGPWAAVSLCQFPAAVQAVFGTLVETNPSDNPLAPMSLEAHFGGELEGGESQFMWLAMDSAVSWLVSQGYIQHHSGQGWRGVYSVTPLGGQVYPSVILLDFPVSD